MEVRAVTSRILSILISSTWAHALFAFFRRIGALGLFLLGICDSSFLFLPFGNDLLLIALVSGGRHPWRWVIYTLAAALGSVVGVALLDLVMRKAGEEGLEKFVGPKRLEKLKGKIEKRGVWAVFFAALLPPPFPFTAAAAAASALQMARRGMLTAVFAGRLVREHRRIITGALFRPPVTSLLEVGLCRVSGLWLDHRGRRRRLPDHPKVASGAPPAGTPDELRHAGLFDFCISRYQRGAPE
jgi:membrane protein YqaA with SNARE-associated domain